MAFAFERLQRGPPMREKEQNVDLAVLALGFVAGIAFGILTIGFLALGAYNRGYDDALFRRKDWRAELVARQAVAARTVQPVRRAS